MCDRESSPNKNGPKRRQFGPYVSSFSFSPCFSILTNVLWIRLTKCETEGSHEENGPKRFDDGRRHYNLINWGNGTLESERPVSKDNNRVKIYIAIPWNQKDCGPIARTIWFPRSELRCMGASTLFCNREVHWDALNCWTFYWELHCGFEADKINLRPAYGNFHRA